MNIKNLSIAVVVLALLAGITAFLTRPAPPPETDPRVGEPLLAPATANAAQSIRITQGDATVSLSRDAAADTWRVSSFHDLPANLNKLRAFVRELTDAKIERVVTRNPERAARLELDSAQITLTATDGSNWEVSLGKTAERGGRYVRLDDSENSPAYLTPFGGYLDAASKNWAENKLVNLERDQIASITLTFDDDEPITITRASIDADWTSTSLPEGQQLKVGAISTLLSAGTTLRFSDATVPDDPDAIDAAAHSRTLTFTTFGGESLALTMGRRPEKTVAKAADSTDETAAAETTEDLTETIPAGPTFAKVEGPATLAPLASANAKIAFKISDYSFASLPGSSEGMFEPKPKPATAVPAESDTPKS